MSSVRRIAETLLAIVQNRIELFGAELQEEKARLIGVVIWAAAAIFLGLLSIILLTATVVFVCPEEARSYVLIGFTLAYSLLFLYAAVSLKRQLKDRPPPFADSVSELKKDLSWIRSQE